MTQTELAAVARRYGWIVLAAATSVVIAISAIRGVARGYQPVSDNALIEIRGRDVFTGDHPLLGTWSSASVGAGIDVNHPGPLLFDLVAVPIRLFGAPAGIAFAVAALHIAVVWTVGWVARRAGGPTAAITAMAVTAGLVWTLGSELLYDPWQPNVLVLPFWLLLCTVWAVMAGDVRLFPLACGVGSFAMQTHLGYVTIVPVLLGVAAVAAAVRVWPDRRHELRRPTVLSIAVIGVLWAQPLWEQFFGPGRGNLGRVVTAGTGGGDDFEPVASTTTGLTLGVRMLGSVLALPPWWGRPGYDDSIPGSTQTVTADGLEIDVVGLSSFGSALLGLLVVMVAGVVAWRFARRAGARRVEFAFATLITVLAVAAITVVITPIDIIGLSPHKVRWLWAIGAFLTFTLAMAVLASLSPQQRQYGVGALAVVAGLALVATVPSHANQSGPTQFAATYDSIEDLRRQLDVVLDDLRDADGAPIESVLFDADGIGFGEPYTAPVMAEFLRNGIDLVVDDSTLGRQLGPDRRADPNDPNVTPSGETRPTVFVRAGSAALDVPAGVERLAFHDGDPSPFSLTDVTDRAVAVFVTTDATGDTQ